MVMSKRIYKPLKEEDVLTAEANGVPKDLLRRRLNEWGWSREKAITQPKNEANVMNGTWDKWKDKAVVSHGTFRVRILRGWSEQEAALRPASPRRS